MANELAKVADGALVDLRIRVPLRKPLSPQQMIVACLLSERWCAKEIGVVLGVKVRTVQYHVHEAALKIPGDGRPIERIVLWYRGAPLDVLLGRHLHCVEELPPSIRQAVLAKRGSLSVHADQSPPRAA